MENFIFCAVTAFIQKFSGYFILKIEARKNLKSLLVHFEKKPTAGPRKDNQI